MDTGCGRGSSDLVYVWLLQMWVLFGAQELKCAMRSQPEEKKPSGFQRSWRRLGGHFPLPSKGGGAFHSERRAGAKVKSLGCHNVFTKDKCYLEETLPARPRVAHKGLAVSPRNARDSGSLLGGFWISSALTHWIILSYNYWGQISVHHELTEAESMLQMYLHLPVLSQPEFMN